MSDVATYPQREAIAVRAVETTPGTKLTGRAVRTPGSLLNVITAIAAAMADDTESRMQAKLRALTMSAEGTELDAVIAERTFRLVLRQYASAAAVPVSLSRVPTASPLTLTAGRRIDVGGVEFTLDTTVSWAAGFGDATAATATAASAGSATNVPLGTPAALVAQDAGENVSVVITDNAAGGTETETDPALRARAQLFPRAVQRGTFAALEFGALAVPGIRQAVAVEAGEGMPVLYVADANGQCNAALLLRVRSALRAWACCGLPPRVVGAIPSWQSIVLKLGVLSGYSPEVVRAQAKASVLAAVNSGVPNGTLQRSLIFATLRTIPGAVVGDDAVVTPALDLVPATPGTTYRTREDLVSFA